MTRLGLLPKLGDFQGFVLITGARSATSGACQQPRIFAGHRSAAQCLDRDIAVATLVGDFTEQDIVEEFRRERNIGGHGQRRAVFRPCNIHVGGRADATDGQPGNAYRGTETADDP